LPIFIMPLIGVILTSLDLISDLATGIFIDITLIGMLLALIDKVEKRIAANVEKASEAGTVGKRKLKTLYWPKDSLRGGLQSFGLSVLLFLIQIAVDRLPVYIPLLSTYDIFAYGAVALGLIGGFYTALVAGFILDPHFRPRINLAFIFLGVSVSAGDVMTIFFLILLYPTFETMPIVGKVFMLLLVPSIVSSIPYLWAKWTGKNPLLAKVTFVLVVSPYVFLIALYFIVYALVMIDSLSLCVPESCRFLLEVFF